MARPVTTLIQGMVTGETSTGEAFAPFIESRTQYNTFVGTATTGAATTTSTIELTMTSIDTAYAVQIINYTTSTTLQIKLDTSTNDSIHVQHDATDLVVGRVIDDQKFKKLFIRNTSGSDITYDIFVQGV